MEARNIDGKNACDLPTEKLREVRKRLDDAGLAVFSMGSPIGKIDIEKDDFAAHLERYKRTIEAAHILGTDKIRLFSFFMPKGKDPALYKDEVIDRLGQFVEIAQSEGVLACHENEKGIFGDIADRCAQLLYALPALCAVFDPANFVQCGEDTAKCWDALRPYIVYIHIKDAVSTDKENVLCGTGEGKIPELLHKAIVEEGYTGFLTLEPHLVLFDSLQSLETTDAKNIIRENKYKNGAEGYAAQYHALCDILAKF